MQWASAISDATQAEPAVDEVLGALRERLRGQRPRLCFVFASPRYGDALAGIAGRLEQAFEGTLVVGCSGDGVLAAGREVERRPALAVTAGVLPGVELGAMHLRHIPAQPGELAELLGGDRPAPEGLIVLPDPFTVDAEALLGALDAAFPQTPKIGGLASGGDAPGQTALFLGRRLHRGGSVVITLRGPLRLDTVVAQGCKPVGTPLMVTRCEGHEILEVNGRKPVELLQEIHEGLDARDKQLFRSSLFLGLELEPEKSGKVEFEAGDYLIRNLTGMDPETGAIAIAGRVQPWQAVQFHVRDNESSAQDLRDQLSRYVAAAGGREQLDAEPGLGALLFSCMGRGEFLYGEPHHDSSVFRAQLGERPIAGFFCNGEIGPVGGRTFLHGYTSAFGIFREAR